MDTELIMEASGNVVLADVLCTALDQLRPHSTKQQGDVVKMQKMLLDIRKSECVLADKEAAS